MPPDRILALRKRLGLSRAAFALRYRLNVGSLAQWETGRREPDTAVQTLLTLIERDAETIAKLLR